MVMVVNSALVRTHQSTYSGSFGPVLPPGSRMGKLHPLGSRASRCGGAHPTSSRGAMPTSRERGSFASQMGLFCLYTYFGVFGMYCVQDTYFLCILYVFRVSGCIVVDPHVFL